MTHGPSNGHMTDDVTWPWKVELVTPIRSERNYLENDWRYRDSVTIKDHQQEMIGYQMVTWPMTSHDPQRCFEAVRSAILATAWLLVYICSETCSLSMSAAEHKLTMQDLHTAAWPVPYSGTLRPDSLGEDHFWLGESANRTVFLHRCPTVQRHVQPLTGYYW